MQFHRCYPVKAVCQEGRVAEDSYGQFIDSHGQLQTVYEIIYPEFSS
jgi:hypothetical protein